MTAQLDPPGATSEPEKPNPAAPRSPRRWPWIAAAVVLAVLLIVSLISRGDASADRSPGPAPSPAPAPPSSAAYAPFGYATMPNFVGMTGDQASAASNAADFKGVNFTQNYAAMSSRVVSQYPAPGTSWNKIDPISLTLDPATATPSTYVAPAPTATYSPPPTEWTYKITGAKKASITYSNSSGGSAQETSAKVPWTKKVDSPGYAGMDFAYVSAQNAGSGTISCQIINPTGTVVAENSSEGEYAIVTCSSS